MQPSPPTTSRKSGETTGNRTGELGPVEQWLGKYLIKQRDDHTLLVYPRPGGSEESEVGDQSDWLSASP